MLSNANDMLQSPPSNPAASYEAAIVRARAFMALDDDTIFPQSFTSIHDHGERRPWSVVLFHGITNNPEQWLQFAPLVYNTGANVFVPRLPKHGYRDRMTPALATLTAEELLASAYEAIDIACGLGERVAVLGISVGSLLCAYAAQFRDDVHTSVPVDSFFALLHLPYWMSKTLGATFLTLPNMFMWWDPRAKNNVYVHTGYPRFATHGLMQSLRIGEATDAAAKSEAPLASRIIAMVNEKDPAVNNAVTKALVERWQARRPEGIEYRAMTDLPVNHDIVDPTNPLQRIDIVYPRLLDALNISA